MKIEADKLTCKKMLKSDTEAPANQWDKVDDFKWLKAEASPNWSVLPEAERVVEDVWKNVVCGNPSYSTDDILRKVGAMESKK